MPPNLPLSHRLLPLVRKPFICRACRQRQAIHTSNHPSAIRQYARTRGRRTQLPTRAVSTTPSVTAVNAKREIPPAYRKLHASLKALEQDAGVYVDTSQLRLALRGVESENSVTRVAVLGLNGQAGARRLTRALLADPLKEEEGWERQLVGSDEGDGRALLLRYGESPDVDDRHPLVRTLSIPSSILDTHKLEILVHAITSTVEPEIDEASSFLVPGLEMTNSYSGRSATVTYPVHKALLYEEGLTSLGTFGKIEALTAQRQKGFMLKGVIDWSWSTSQRDKDDQPVSPINLGLAETAVEAFRKSLDKSMEYEHLWFDAGMPSVSAWLSEGTEGHQGTLKPAVGRLVETICDNANQGISREEAAKIQQEKAATVPIATKKIISQGLSIWAENSHTELRDRLNSAFYSKSWRKTKWWKLLWRVDDVGYVAADILQRAWLVEAEKEMIWNVGRIHQSGLLGPPKLRPTRVPDPEDAEQTLGGSPPAPSTADLIPQTSNVDFSEPPPVKYPWPQDIARARSSLSSLTVPSLQALGQALLLQTISTNVLASSLSALLYISVSTTSPYESGAIAATGLVYSLRRLQKRWETAREEWEAQLREEGRRVLRRVEELAREAVEGEKAEVDEVGIRERAVAIEAVGNVREALGELHG